MSDRRPPLTASDRLDKARALLLSMVADHENIKASGDHAWRKCRPCLARQELDSPHACQIIRELIAAYDRLNTMPLVGETQ